MTMFTTSDLDNLEAAAKAEGRECRPAPTRNGRMFLLMPEADRSYKAVADKAGVTEGRAGVYVREYLTFIDKLDEAPQRGRRAGNGGTRSITTGNGMLDTLINSREQYLSEQDRLATAINDANAKVETFDADEWIADAATDLQNQIKVLEQRLADWTANKDDIATKSAESYNQDLVAHAAKLDKESGDKLEFLDKQVTDANAMLAFMVQRDDTVLKVIETQNKDLALEIAAEAGVDFEPASDETKPEEQVVVPTTGTNES